MNQSGFVQQLSKCVAIYNLSLLDILNDDEFLIVKNLVRIIAERNHGHDVKVIFELKEAKTSSERNLD